MQYKKQRQQLSLYKKRFRVCARLCVSITCLLGCFALYQTFKYRETVVAGPTETTVGSGIAAYFQYPTYGAGKCAASVPWRSSDGSDHGMEKWHGAAHTRLGRYQEPGEYTQDYDERGRPNARAVSNALCDQTGEDAEGHAQYTSLVWIFGQFLDHAISLSPEEAGVSAVRTDVTGDAHFDPTSNGASVDMESSDYVEEPVGHRHPFSIITHFVDGNLLYGSSPERTAALRAFDGTGKVATHITEAASKEAFPPNNTLGLENVGGKRNKTMFLLGDLRGNENIALASLHVLFLREHNYQAERLKALNSEWDDECLFQASKKIVVAEFQKIVYEEFVPALLGETMPSPEVHAYNASVDPRVYVEFSGAAYRLHTLVNEHLFAHDPASGEAQEHVRLVDGFMNPDILRERGISPFLLGAVLHKSEKLDLKIVDSLRNLLFAHTRSGPLDLAAINIMRGRQVAVPSYSELRAHFQLPPVTGWADVTSDATLQTTLAEVYGANGYSNLDAWIGLMAEDKAPGKALGATHAAILMDQFTRLRNGDAFYHAWDKQMTHAEHQYIGHCTLRAMILRNTKIVEAQLPENLFVV